MDGVISGMGHVMINNKKRHDAKLGEKFDVAKSFLVTVPVRVPMIDLARIPLKMRAKF